MYCKNCGKVISDDSKYCQYCGKNIETDLSSQFFFKHKRTIILYSIWFIINLLFLMMSGFGRNYDSLNYISPFQYCNNIYDCYDFTELIIYCVLIPLIVYYIKTYKGNWFKNKT